MAMVNKSPRSRAFSCSNPSNDMLPAGVFFICFEMNARDRLALDDFDVLIIF